MRARKLAAVELEDPPPPDDVADVFLDDDLPANREEDAGSLGRICIACGGDDTIHDGCAHTEVARIDAPSRALHDAVLRLRRAAVEQRAAVRALRSLVLSEVARGRGDLETAPAPRPEPCPRCLIRDAEEAAAAAAAGLPPKPVRRRGKGEGTQQALPFKA
ncbi:Hypothetical protein A7982_02738 [Minicystis rosea]|nr:Hypothetical protein A7982_02738 [Minicystis rosea]